VNHCYDSRSPPFMLYATRKLRFSRWKQKIACKRDVVCMRSLVQLSFFLIRSFSIPRTRTESKVLVHHPDFSRVSAFRYPHPLALSLPHLPLFLLHLLPASRLAPAQALWLLNNVVVEDKSEMNTLACQRARVHALPMAWNERTLRHRIARGRSWTKAIWHAADDGHDIHDCPATRARSYPLFLFIAEYTFIYHSANATFWGFIRRPLKKNYQQRKRNSEATIVVSAVVPRIILPRTFVGIWLGLTWRYIGLRPRDSTGNATSGYQL